MRLTPLFAFAILAAACVPKSDTPGTPAAPVALTAAQLDTVKAVDAAFAAGMNAKDTTAVFALYAPDAKLMPQDSPVIEGDGLHGLVKTFMAEGASDFVLTTTTAYGIGDLAYLVGSATFKMGGATQTIKDAEVLRRGADGKWRYVVDMFSNVAPPAPAVAPVKKSK